MVLELPAYDSFEKYVAVVKAGLLKLLETARNTELPSKSQILELVESSRFSDVPIWPLLGATGVLYLGLVQILRFRSLRKQTKAYAAYLKDPYKLDYKAAHPIMKRVMLYEAPWMYAFSTQWALIKTYAVAPGTGLLVQTRQLTSESTVGKRAEDTSVVLTEFLVGDMDGDRGSKALAKMNWLHRRYGSKIGQKELLSTLAMFVLEPITWFEKYEWRPMTELEKVAIYTYWKEVGNRMGIKNIPDTLPELEAWVVEYEKEAVYFTENNRKCAEATMGLFLRNLPPFMRGFFQHAAVSLFDDTHRAALGYEKPPMWIAGLVSTIFQVRRFMIRNLFLPRFQPLDPLPKPDSDGRLYRDLWAFEPWYVKNTMRNWLDSLFWTSGKNLPGPQYKSGGFLPEELGPVEYEKASKEPVVIEAAEMRAYAAEKGFEGAAGCPFKPVGFPFKYSA
jgi:hypothetical protein